MKLKKQIAFLLIIFLFSISGINAIAAEQEAGIQDNTLEPPTIQSIDSKTEISVTTDGTADNEKDIENNEDDLVKPEDRQETDDAKEQVEADVSIKGESQTTKDTTEKKEASPVESDTNNKEESTNKEEIPKEDDTPKEEESTKKPAYTDAELRLLSALIYCEAQSEPYAGKLSVGIVVINRKKSNSFPNTIKGVIYQKSQFGPVKNGTLDKALEKYDSGKFTSTAQKDCIKAAKEALSGTTKVIYKDKTYNLKGYLYFNGRVKNHKLQIANHQFK